MLNKKSSGKQKKRTKLVFPLIGVGLVCVFVVAFFVMNHNISFGDFHPHSTYIASDGLNGEDLAPQDISVEDRFVTPKTKEGHPDGVLNTGSYPSMPETDGGKKNRGTKENPFVILEIVPEMAQQTLSHMVSTQEEGLPYDPIKVGIKISDNILNSKGYADKTSRAAIEAMTQQHCMVNHKSESFPIYENGKQTGTMNVPQDKGPNAIQNPTRDSDYMEQHQNSLPGWFRNKISTEIYDPEGTVTGNASEPGNENSRVSARNKYARVGKYFEVSTTSDTLPLEDYAKKTVAEINALYPTIFVEETADGAKAIRTDALNDEVNWNKNIELEKEYHYTFKAKSDVMTQEDFDGKTMAQLISDKKYADIFKNEDGTMVPEDVANDEARWVKKAVENKDEKKEDINKNAYLVFVPMGEGEYYTNGSFWSGSKLYKASNAEEKAKSNIMYVESLDAYPSHTNIADKYAPYQIAERYTPERIAELEGMYMQASALGGETPKVISYDIYTEYSFSYDYVLYKYTYTYYNLKVNDLLKRMFFCRDSDQAYEDVYVKVIVATPDMINEVDSKDTTTALSYVERADMFFFNALDDEEYSWEEFVKFYYEYIIEDPGAYDKNNIASFVDNDLEWIDCMKIIERLSTEMNMPMMFTKEVGDMLNEGVHSDGSSTAHIYLDSATMDKNEISSLNNIAKLYLITSQFNLGAVKGTKNYQGEIIERTFMDDIYPNLKQIPIVKNGKNTANYTGYYDRQVCMCSDLSEPQEKNSHYLWNRYTFIPTDSGFNGNDNRHMWLEKYGFLYTYLNNNNNLQNGQEAMYTKLTGVRVDHDFDNDPQNVTMVGRDIASINETLFNDNTMGVMGIIIYKIMNQGTPETPTMQFSVEKYSSGDSIKLKYTKIDNASVLLDYSSDAKYKSDKTLYLKCKLINNTYLSDGSVQVNNQDGVIKSVKLVNDASNRSIELINVSGDSSTVLESDKTKVENGFNPSVPFEISSVIFKDDAGEPMQGLDANQGPIKGIQVASAKTITFWVPFNLYDWQDGYNKVEVTWVARCSKGNNAYQNEGTNEVTIGERTLFNLE